MNAVKDLLKVIGAILILGATIALPAIGGENTENDIRVRFANNTANGVVKGLELRGKTLSPEEKKAVYELGLKAADKIIPLVKKAGLFEDYAKQLFDPDIMKLDRQALEAKNIDEVQKIMDKELDLIRSRYPVLYIWVTTSVEATEVMTEYLREVAKQSKKSEARVTGER